MKNAHTRILALLMALALLVPGLALAEDADAVSEALTEAVETIETVEAAGVVEAEAPAESEEAEEPAAEEAAEAVEAEDEAEAADEAATPVEVEPEAEEIAIEAIDDAVDEVGEVSLEAEMDLVSEPEELVETSDVYMDPHRPNLDAIDYGEPDPNRYNEDGSINYNSWTSIPFKNLPKPIQDALHPYYVEYADESTDFVDFYEDQYLSPQERNYVKYLTLEPASDGTVMTKEDLKWLEIFPKLEEIIFSKNSYKQAEDDDSGLLDLTGLNLPKVTGISVYHSDNISAVNLGDIRPQKMYIYDAAFPEITGDLSRLDTVYMEAVHFPNGLDISRMPNVKDLSIYECTGLEPLDLSAGAKLEELQLVGCDTVNLTLGSLQNLSSLGVYSFEDLISKVSKLDVSGCTNLRMLDYDARGAEKEELILGSKPRLTHLGINGARLDSVDISDCPYLIMAINSVYSDDEDYETGAPYIHYTVGKLLKADWSEYMFSPQVNVAPNTRIIPTPTAKKYSSTVTTNPTVKPTPAPTPTPAPAAPEAPAAPATPTIAAVKKSGKTTVTAAPGAVYQLDLGGAVGKAFKSSKKKVATVDQNGLVTVKKAGKTKITFKVGKKKRTVTLVIKDPTIPTAIALNLTGNVPAQVGVPQMLSVILPEGTSSGIKWKSSNKKVATVSNGVVTFKKAGKVTITATATRGKKKAKVKFTVSK